DTVLYYNESKKRHFPRTPSVIGRQVKNCHPPKSVHVVEGIIADFKDNKKDFEEFWINFKGETLYIAYYAVRDESGEYLGVLEVSQDITKFKKLTGEKRLRED
ncbi:MAG: PAS domain-containing protein, partial [Candidatus Izemoplasmatales bacterium]|nr:PAS domain-containing protein [Candidatus Izemoplasmatales bacterium]